MTSTHFEFQSYNTKLWLPLQKGQKSPKEVTSWLLLSVESQEGVSIKDLGILWLVDIGVY